MRHAYFGRRLGRDTNARKALLNNLASSLLINGNLTTTLAKAKFAKTYVEKLITQAKRNDLRNKRILATILETKAFNKLISSQGPGFATRSGGYTRIIKLNPRRGDAAPMARLELLAIEKKAATTETKSGKHPRGEQKKKKSV